MIIYYHCTRDSALLLSFLLTCHCYIPFHFFILAIIDDVKRGSYDDHSFQALCF